MTVDGRFCHKSVALSVICRSWLRDIGWANIVGDKIVLSDYEGTSLAYVRNWTGSYWSFYHVGTTYCIDLLTRGIARWLVRCLLQLEEIWPLSRSWRLLLDQHGFLSQVEWALWVLKGFQTSWLRDHLGLKLFCRCLRVEEKVWKIVCVCWCLKAYIWCLIQELPMWGLVEGSVLWADILRDILDQLITSEVHS